MRAKIDAHFDSFTDEKRQKIARSSYAFFRGTAVIFYERLFTSTEDLARPAVLSNGDVHPFNFGIVPLSDVPVSGRVHLALNDFDEACHAPFSVDVKRGATGFELFARQLGLGKHERADVVSSFVRGYLEEIKKLEVDPVRAHKNLTRDHAEGEAKRLLDEAHKIERAHFLAHYVDGDRFKKRDNVIPAPEMVASLAPVIHALGDKLTVVDVAHRLGSGTASAGLERYYVLVRASEGDSILEVKLAVPSTLRPFVRTAPLAHTAGESAAKAQREIASSWARSIQLDGVSYSVRERCPQKATLPEVGVTAAQLADWAATCGLLLARAHGRSRAHASKEVRAALVA
ncbi:MAG TPA: DUF2252 family protein, partial [Myxococcota bacterium]